MAPTSIQWTGMVWNPTTGCDQMSPGCDHCYALTMARRLKAMGSAKYQQDGDPRTSGPGFGLRVHPDALDLPLQWIKPRRVFVNSMSDLGHARVPPAFTARVWSVMARTPQHTYQILSKRPGRIAAWVNRCSQHSLHVGYPGTPHGPDETCSDHPGEIVVGWDSWPLPNVHIGTSIELDEYCHRAGALRETPAAVRFLSLEPLLGPLPSLDLTGIHWVILGAESGSCARPADLGWFRELIAMCREAGTAIFVKQLGSCWAREHGGQVHGADWSLWPEDLRIREFPLTAGRVTS
jgi:protein gp37